MFPGGQIINVDSVNSTNDLAAQLLASPGLSEGSMVIAKDQTAGRGQMGALWWSEPGSSLTMSLILKPEFLVPSELFGLNMAIGVAMCDFISDMVKHQALIKWPNDIVCRGSKVCGILIENSIANDKVRHSVIGIGLNVNQESFPAFLPHAISLKMVSGRTFDVESLVEPVNDAIAQIYALLREDVVAIRRLYHERLLGLGKKRLFSKADQMFLATIIGVTDTGRLQLGLDDGSTQTFAVKEVAFVQ